MKLTLNIGLDSDVYGPLNHATVLDTVQSAGFAPLRHELAESATEQTLVVEVLYLATAIMSWQRELYFLAESLGQDCIAAVTEHGKGVLIGPGAYKWGAFNPEFFLGLREEVAA